MKLTPGLMAALALAACGDNEPGIGPDATTARAFTLRIDNIAPWTVLKAGSQTTRTTSIDGPAGPGEAYEIRFTAAPHHVVSFATMLRESNDWFFAPAPEGIPLYVDGQPLAGDVTHLVRLWDAGTEADQEPGVGDATAARQLERTAGAPDANTRIREVFLETALADGRTFVRPPTSAMLRVTLTPGTAPGAEQQFTLRIENVSTAQTLLTSEGARPITLSPFAWALHHGPGVLFAPGAPVGLDGLEQLAEAGQPDSLGTTLRLARGYATALSPGVFVVHRGAAPLFEPGTQDRGEGLEPLAEDGDQVPLRELLAARMAEPATGMIATGAFETPHGLEATGAAPPGMAYQLTLSGQPGEALSFATKFAMSNDWFFATRPEGIALFDGDIPRSCDVTAELGLYDLGTEVDEELDVGPSTAPLQGEPNTGRPDRDPRVREVTLEHYPVHVGAHLRVTLAPR